MKILVADDDPVARHLLSARLESWEYEPITVHDGDAAWAALRVPDGPSLAVLDWMMPGMDGPEICRRLRAERPRGPRYVILLTARGAGSVSEGLEAGADDFVSKPFDARELRARVGVGARVVRLEQALLDRVRELERARARLDTLGELVPICAWCKRVRSDSGYWQQLERFVALHVDVSFNHGICPECSSRHLGIESDDREGVGR